MGGSVYTHVHWFQFGVCSWVTWPFPRVPAARELERPPPRRGAPLLSPRRPAEAAWSSGGRPLLKNYLFSFPFGVGGGFYTIDSVLIIITVNVLSFFFVPQKSVLFFPWVGFVIHVSN